MENVIAQHITKTPGVCGGRPCIAGHRIRVQDIVVMHEMNGMSAKEILREYPTITFADVYSALAYYYDHEEEIREDFRKEDELYEWVKANIPSRIPPRSASSWVADPIRFYFEQPHSPKGCDCVARMCSRPRMRAVAVCRILTNSLSRRRRRAS